MKNRADSCNCFIQEKMIQVIKLFLKLSFRTSIHAAYVSKDQVVLTLQLHFKKPVPKDYCWELFLQFANQFALRANDLCNVWFDGMLVDRPNRM